MSDLAPASNGGGAAKPPAGRSPILAFLLGAFGAPGLGHLYAGLIGRALAAVAISQLGLVAILALFILPLGSPFAIAAGAAIAVALLLGIPLDAARVAKRGRPFARRRWVEIGALVAYAMILGTIDRRVATWIRSEVATPYRCPSGAMAPTLLVGDAFFTNLRAYRTSDPRRGDVVVFNVAKDGTAIHPADLRPDLPLDVFVKRIVGVPGDTIEVRGGNLYLNGARVATRDAGRDFRDEMGRTLRIEDEDLAGRDHAILDDARSPGHDIPPTRVDADRYFVMGDDRDYSNDSRFWGTVQRRDLIGVATHLYWSADPTTGEVRWSRIGSLVR